MDQRLFNIYVENDQGHIWCLYAKTVKVLRSLHKKIHSADSFLLDWYKIEVCEIIALKVFSIESSMIPEEWSLLPAKELERAIDQSARHTSDEQLDLFEDLGYEVTEEFQSQDWEFFENQTSNSANSNRIAENFESHSIKPLFISHASKDKKIVDQFVDEVLERGLGIDQDTEVYYTSGHVTGIRAGADFREDIRQGLIGAKIVFCFITENYTASQYCIAELGAAWAFEKVIIPIRIPPKSKMQGGELYAILQAIDGSDRLALNRLRDDLVNIHLVGKRIESSAKWEKALGKFLDAIAHVESAIDTEGKK